MVARVYRGGVLTWPASVARSVGIVRHGGDMVARFMPLDFSAPAIFLTEDQLRAELRENGYAAEPAGESEEQLALAAFVAQAKGAVHPTRAAVTRQTRLQRQAEDRLP